MLKLIERRDLKRQRENARTFVALARDLGYTDTDLRHLVAHVDEKQEPLVHLVEQQKLRDVSIPDLTDHE